MTEKIHIIASLKELETFATTLAAEMRAGEVYGFSGPLGAGKTTLIQMLGRAFGVTSVMVSPTFVFRKEYRTPKTSWGIRKIIHLDAYRISGGSAEDLGELVESKAVTLIEWPERIKARLSPKITQIKINLAKDDTRIISVDRYGLK